MTEPSKNDAPAAPPAERYHRKIAAELRIGEAQVATSMALSHRARP
ncbi:MAG: hypothetical protein L6300_06340 [Syntrophaceae bacterium]|nr:hypothetical protein [Syntrophaceae bacterium]